jgi:hypothetical protein
MYKVDYMRQYSFINEDAKLSPDIVTPEGHHVTFDLGIHMYTTGIRSAGYVVGSLRLGKCKENSFMRLPLTHGVKLDENARVRY